MANINQNPTTPRRSSIRRRFHTVCKNFAHAQKRLQNIAKMQILTLILVGEGLEFDARVGGKHARLQIPKTAFDAPNLHGRN
jgi:stringent starvation protein B